MTRPFPLVIAAVLCAAPAFAQAPPSPEGSPMVAAAKGQFAMVKGYIVKSADKVGEDLYGFKPTPEVRSFGQLFGHIANANYMICSRAAGEKSPSTEDIEKTKTTKADITKALGESFAYCEGVFAKMDEKTGAEMVDFFRQKQPRLAVLQFNTAHDFEHYGNLVTYMRLKGIVPPSSEGGM